MALTLMYITNNPMVAIIAQRYGVDRIWIDLETLGKEERQYHIASVKSHHTIEDINRIRPIIKESELLVRINPINPETKEEIDAVIEAGADILMLPMWKSVDDVERFIRYVNGRVKTTLLLETKEAVDSLDAVLALGGFDEIHIGLNDLHLSYGLSFMFALLANGTIEKICKKISRYKIPFGFGGIAKIGEGQVSSEKIIMEHYRLGSTRAILSRSFCNAEEIEDINSFEDFFSKSLIELRTFEKSLSTVTETQLLENTLDINRCVSEIVSKTSRRNT